ncbi:MAG: DctP family TRAP transporter solute-binding subunit [Deltaproteobacteria bacterium]|nr:DctP family TRAP transporter solute-binding subunit [Deltaproteobacteria bacterium]MBM4324755.1 DctP family TRAP transporter solute-binding subunit [Deltaproteobacteria bacterium]
MERFRILFISIMVSVILILCSVGISIAAPIILKLAHVVSTSAPYHIGAMELAKLVDLKTKGQIKIEIFPGGQLGKGERECVEGLQIGTIDLVVTSTGPVGGFVPQMLVVDLPFLFRDNGHVDKVLDGPIGEGLLKDLSKAGINGIAFWENGFRNLTNNKRPVNKPEDVKGLKLRTMENEVHMDAFRTLGADPTPMTWGEVYTSLQQGVIDGQENPINIIRTHKIYEVNKHLSLTGHVYSPALLLMNEKKFKGLSPDLQKALIEAGKEAARFERKFIRDNEAKMLEELKGFGMQVTNPDKKLLQKATESTYKKYESRFGKDLIDKIVGTQ